MRQLLLVEIVRTASTCTCRVKRRYIPAVDDEGLLIISLVASLWK